MATDLACNLVHKSSDEETAVEDLHTGCLSAIKFLAKLSSIIAVEVPGARKDLKTLPWRYVPLIPDTTELHEARLKTDDLPKIKPEGNYQSKDKYLDTHFRLLREECFYKLRKGISGFVTNRGQFDSKDMMMYRIVLMAVSTGGDGHYPTAMSIALKYTALDSKPDADAGDLSSWLMYGDLLCISIDNSFQEPIWATVEKHVAEQRIVWIILCGGANVINEAQFITKMQDVTDRNEQAFMAESQTFYAAYAPAMDVLKHKDCVPFEEFLVHPETNTGSMKPADYIKKITQQPDWGIIFKREHLPDHSHHEDNESYSLLEEFDELKNDHKCPAELDDTQLEAVELVLKNKLALIQGPPGTGKSFVGVALVQLLLSMNVPQNHGPILVITYKNFALNDFLEDCVEKVSLHDVKIVRVGRLPEEAPEKLKNCLLKKVGGRWPQQRYEQKRTLTGRLWAMQSQVREAIRKLRESSSFNAEIFLKEASRDQIKYLLLGKENETVDEANVERLLDAQDHGCLKKLVEKALKKWLPAQKKFDSFAREEKGSPEESGKAKPITKDNASKSKKSSTGSKKERNKEDQDQENRNDLRDPAMEQEERLLAVDEDLPLDDEDNEIMEIKKKEDLVPQGRGETIDEACTRKLISIGTDETDETKVKDFRGLLNVWELPEEKRIQLVYDFQNSHRRKARAEFLAVSGAYKQIHQELEELKSQHNIEVMRTCDVIGMTVTGATIRANQLADIKPSVMIVEEAAEILEGQLVAVIPPSVQHLIMIGDHKQLKPLVNFHRLKKHHLDLSMFERLVNCNLPYKQLEFQSRMRDEFADLLRQLNIYNELKTNEERVLKYEVPQCVKKSMYFWTHKEFESDSKNTHSKLNEEEAIKITGVAETFCREGQVDPLSITVLCSYRGQVTEIKNRFLRSQVKELRDIPVSTIDSYQGRENYIILLSLVRSSKSGIIGHLSSPNRLCVAISRAHCGLYLFGNDGQLSKASKPWKKVTDAMRKKGCLGDTFPFSSSSQFRSQAKAEDQMEGLSPGKGPETLFVENLTVINAVNVIHAGDNSRNTIITTPADPASGRRLPPDLPRVPQSEKIPVHHPKSPAPPEGCPLPRMEGGSGSDDTNPDFVFVQVAETEGRGANVKHVVESTKDARMPIQESPKAVKSSPDSSEIEKEEQRPVQESEDPKNSLTDATITDGEIMEGGKEARQPTQESPEAEKASPDSSEIEKEEQRPVQESEDPKNRPTDTTITDEEIMGGGKEARKPTEETSEVERPSPDSSEIEKEEQRPVQESEDPKNSLTDTTITDEEIVEGGKEARQPIRETSEAEKPPDSSEIEKEEQRPVQESEDPKNSIKGMTVKKEVTTDDKEATQPAQATSEAEKLSVDVSELENMKERPVQESENQKNSITETTVMGEEIMAGDKEARRPTQATSEAEKSCADTSELENMKEKPIQESENPKRSIADTPTLEDELMKEAPVQESEEPPVRKKELEDHPVRSVRQVFQESELKDSASSDVQTKSNKEEALPTQETMPAGKGPIEETGLEVGVKGQPTDEQE